MTSVFLIVGFVALGLLASEVVVLHRRAEAMTASLADPSAGGRPSVVFVFRPADCPTALDDIDRWNAVARDTGVYVSGLILTEGQPRRVIDELLESYKVGFPVRVRKPTDVAAKLSSLGNPRLPVSIVLDERGSVRAILPVRSRRTTDVLKELIVRSVQ